MIACEKCAYVNPLGTRFCRQCGEKLNIQFAQVMTSVHKSKKIKDERGIVRSGTNVLTIGAFLFITTLGAYALLVPQAPAPDLPSLQTEHLVPDHLAGTPVSMPVGNGHLGWRRSACDSTLAEAGVSLAQVHTLQSGLLAQVKADGSVDGPSPMAAAAAVALALQACPDAVGAVEGAARARGWLTSQLSTCTTQDPTSRSLAILALIDADDIAPATLTPLIPFLTDGKAPVWQTLALLELPDTLRPSDLGSALDGIGPAKPAFLTLLGTPSGDASSEAYLDQVPTGPSEERLAWAFSSWQLAPVPRHYAETMAAWSAALTPPPVNEADAVIGPSGPPALEVLCLCAAVHERPLWLAH